MRLSSRIHLLLLLPLFCFPAALYAQQEKAGSIQAYTEALKAFKPDTSAVPEDRLTAAIRELRKLRGGFNISGVLAYKMQEEAAKSGKADPGADSMLHGSGARWLENAVIHVYRLHFTYEEIIAINAFYRTPAGHKMADAFPLVIMETMAAAQKIQDMVKGEAHPGR